MLLLKVIVEIEIKKCELKAQTATWWKDFNLTWGYMILKFEK